LEGRNSLVDAFSQVQITNQKQQVAMVLVNRISLSLPEVQGSDG
jgi:hypothetical protein